MAQAIRAGARFPLERTAAGYTPASSADLAYSQVPYVLLTDNNGPFTEGAQPWDPDFGSQLAALPFSNLEGDALRAMVAEYIGQALAYCLPQLQVNNLQVTKRKNADGMNVVQVVLHLEYAEPTARGDVSVRSLPPLDLSFPT